MRSFKRSVVVGALLSAALAVAACTDDSGGGGALDFDAGTFDAAGSDAGSSADATASDGEPSDAKSDDASSADATDASDAFDGGDAGDGDAGATSKLIIVSPATVVDEDGGNAVTIPAPNAAVQVMGSTLGGRIILFEPGTVGALVSVLPDGTGRTVLADLASSPNDTTAVRFLAIAPNDTIYYRLTRGAADDLYVGSVKSDGSSRATLLQVSGGTTGATNIDVFGFVPGNDPALDTRYRGRIFTNDSRLVFSQYNLSTLLRVVAVTPDLSTMTTAHTAGANLYDSPCGVTPAGKLIYSRARAPGGSVFDAVSVDLDGTNEVTLTTSVTTYYSCQVSRSGHVMISLDTGNNQRDLYIASGSSLVALATDAAFNEQYVGETTDDRILFHSVDQATGATSIHVVKADGSGSTPLVTTSDAAGAFGGFVALTPTDRMIFVRSATSGADGTVFTMKLDGSERLEFLPPGKWRSYEPYGFTATGRMIYRGTDNLNSPRLYNARLDAVLSPGVPDQFLVTGDPTANLTLVLE